MVPNGRLSHYRDSSGVEVDAIIHPRNGCYAPAKVKLGCQCDIDSASEHLKALDDIIDSEYMRAHSFLMALTAKNAVYTRPDGGNVVPLTYRRPESRTKGE